MDKPWKRIIWQWCSAHPAMAIGTAIGGVLGTLALFFGLWRTLLFFLFVACGTSIGAIIEEPARARGIWQWLRRR
jgi:uncharacterized membrane protein